MTAGSCTTLAERLVAQAEGSRPAEAAAVILMRAVNGWLLDRVEHCIDDYPDVGRAAPDWEALSTARWGMSGGERRLIELSMALGSSTATVNLNDTLTGLDDSNGALVVEAVAHAVGLDVGLLDGWKAS